MFKVTNISGQVIGLVTQERLGIYKQINLPPDETMIYNPGTTFGIGLDIASSINQLYNLCDPVKKILKVEEVE